MRAQFSRRALDDTGEGQLLAPARIALRRPGAPLFVLLASAGASASIVAAPGWAGGFGAALSLVALSIAAVDLRHFRIPDPYVAIGAMLGLGQAALLADRSLIAAVAAALLRGSATAALFWLLRWSYRQIRRRDGLGLGDVKLALVAGIWLEWTVVPIAIELAALSALSFYLLRRVRAGRSIRAAGRLPFGTFFGPAIWAAWLLQSVIPLH